MLLHTDDERDEEQDEVDEFDRVPPERNFESGVVEPSGVPSVVSGCID